MILYNNLKPVVDYDHRLTLKSLYILLDNLNYYSKIMTMAIIIPTIKINLPIFSLSIIVPSKNNCIENKKYNKVSIIVFIFVS